MAGSSLYPPHPDLQEISDNQDTIRLGTREVNSRAYVARFNFSGADQQKKVGQLSGGERNRVHMAKMLKEGANVLLLDELRSLLQDEVAGEVAVLVVHLLEVIEVEHEERERARVAGAPRHLAIEELDVGIEEATALRDSFEELPSHDRHL